MTGCGDSEDVPEEEPWHLYELDSDETPSEGVIQATAAVTNSTPTELESLPKAVDPDTLNAFFGGERDASPYVGFDYAGCEVEVSNHIIRIRERD